MQLARHMLALRLRRGVGDVMPQIVRDALLAACHLQQAAVGALVPFPVQPRLPECAIERHTVKIAFGVGQRAVDIEDQCLQRRMLNILIEWLTHLLLRHSDRGQLTIALSSPFA